MGASAGRLADAAQDKLAFHLALLYRGRGADRLTMARHGSTPSEDICLAAKSARTSWPIMSVLSSFTLLTMNWKVRPATVSYAVTGPVRAC